MISVNKLTKSFNNKLLFKNLTFDIVSGKSLGIVGKNGVGKSTLINILTNVVKPDSGKIYKDFNKNTFFKNVGIQPQNASFDSLLKVKEVIQEYALLQEANLIEIKKYIDILQIKKIYNNRLNTLSFGERQRVNILLAIMNAPKYLFLDEVTTGLDTPSRKLVCKMIKEFKNQSRSIILVSHYSDELFEICDDILFLNDGNVKYYKEIHNFLNSKADFEKLFDGWMEK